MRLDLHVKRMNLEIYERLRMYHYDLVLTDEPFEEGGGGLRVLSRRKITADASVDKKPRPILHASIMDFSRAIELIKRYPNRVMCVEVDLKELRELSNKVKAFKNLTKFSVWLSKRNIPLFFSSGATAAEEVVPPTVLDGLVKLVYSGSRNKKCYRLFLEFLEGVAYG